jgi:uncharacterized phage protein (predicted DNA packaging)
MAVTDLSAAKAHLNVTEATDDALITRLIGAAQAHLEGMLGYAVEDRYADDPDGVPTPLVQAVLMLVAHWYENREASVVGVTAQPVPLGVCEIVADYRDWSWGEPDAAA